MNTTVPSRKSIRDSLVHISTKARYKPWKTLEGCQIESKSNVNDGGGVSGYRITTDMKCDLATFRAFITTQKNTFLFDHTAEMLTSFFLDELTLVTCLHAKYKAASVVSARDYCSWQCFDTIPWEKLTPREQLLIENLRTVVVPVTGALTNVEKGHNKSNTNSSANFAGNARDSSTSSGHHPSEVFFHSSVDSDRVPPVPQWIRGTIHAFGYVAFPIGDGSKIRVTNVSCVDPRGNIPSFALDGANADSAKKLSKIRGMCEMLANIKVNMKIDLPFPEHDLGGRRNIRSKEGEVDRGDDNQADCFADDFVVIDDEPSATEIKIMSNSEIVDLKGEKEAEQRRALRRNITKLEQPPPSQSENDALELDDPTVEKPNNENNGGSASDDQNANSKNDDENELEDVETASFRSAREDPSSPYFMKSASSQVGAETMMMSSPTKANNRELVSASSNSTGVASPSSPENNDPVPEKLRLTDGRQPHFDRILSLHASSEWHQSKTLDNCLLEDMKVGFSHIKATRISSDFKCSVETFAKYMGNLDNQKHYDPKIEVFEVINPNTDIQGIITYSAYKRETRWISPRDFCCHSASFMLVNADAIKRLGFASDVKKVYVSNSNSIDNTKLLDKNWVRGNIHVFGYVATATSTAAERCKVYSIACVDPSGSLPGAVMDAMNVENCKKVALIRRLCEEAQGKEPAELIGVSPQDLSSPKREKVTSNPRSNVVDAGNNDNDNDDSTSDTDSFASCLDEDDLKREADDLKEFYSTEQNAICRRLLALHNFRGWTLLDNKGDAQIETVVTPLCERKAVRVSIESACTLEDFWSVISNVHYARRYDPDVDKLELLQSPPYGSVMYTSYRGVSTGGPLGFTYEPRDFCTITASKFLTEREGSDAQLYTEGIHSAALVINSVDCDDYPPQEGIIRGAVYGHGFIAIATPPTAKRIRIFYIALIDPRGDVPSKIEDMAAIKLADKAVAVSKLAEAFGRGDLKRAGPSDYVKMPDAEEDVYLCQLLRNQTQLNWGKHLAIGSAIVETSALAANRKLTIVRASMEFRCSLTTFENVITNVDNRRKYEPEIDVLQFHDGPANATISTCCYKKDKSITMGGYALSEVTVSRHLYAEELEEFQLVPEGTNAAAVYAMNTVDWSTHVDDALIDEGFVRANVFVNGFIATATPPDASRIRVTHQWCVHATNSTTADDDSRIRKMQQEAANRMMRLGTVCQNVESLKTQAFFSKEEVLFSNNTSFSATRSRTASARPQAGVVDENHHNNNNTSVTRSRAVSTISNRSGGVGGGADDNHTVVGLRSRATSTVVASSDLRYHRLYAKLMGLIDRDDWKKGPIVEGCLIETCAVEYTSFSATRISTTFNCSLETLRDFLKEEENVRKYDVTLDTFELIRRTAESAILYCNYKRQSRLVSPRDFVTENANQMLTREEALGLRLTRRPDNGGAYIQTCISVSNAYREVEKDWVRGTIHAYGFLAIAEEPKKIHVYNYACVDPSGNIPKWISDATTSQSAKTLATIRMFCETIEAKKK